MIIGPEHDALIVCCNRPETALALFLERASKRTFEGRATWDLSGDSSGKALTALR